MQRGTIRAMHEYNTRYRVVPVEMADVEVMRMAVGTTEPQAPAAVEIADRDLILRAQAGDTAAFGQLVSRYMRRAYYSALGLVGSPDDALELSQDAFVRAWRARGRIDPDLPFFAWLYQIIRRLCFNFNRDRSLHRERMREATPWLVAELDRRRDARAPERGLERDEAQVRVRGAIERLPDREREILVLREFEGLRYREIADLLGIPVGTVMSRLYTARRKLAAALEDGS